MTSSLGNTIGQTTQEIKVLSDKQIVKQRRDILEGLLSFNKEDSEDRKQEYQDMATSEEGYYNDVVKERESTEEKGEKSKLQIRGKIPFKFHAEEELPPPLPPSRTSTLRFQTPLHPVTSAPRVTNRTLTRRRQEEEDSFESDKTEAGISMASMA